MDKFKMHWMFITFFYSGHFPKAPGTIGTLFGALFGVLIIKYISIETLSLLTFTITLMATHSINYCEDITKKHDDKRIVIDEVVGIWLALIISHEGIIGIILSILFFRLFDIWKPSVIGRIDKNVKGGWGVIGDDLLAGFFAGISSAGVIYLLKYSELL